ncbi:protein ASPARTIC PROTEASE IN GUARD CELL 2 [Brachypodium distachyon]|uniref:Peptidase A1 domain-containing protein n=1 Tax=Brachypodium distachyon TaxID=15368 RepID=I1J3C5_BRADI|nr:protein ASPARTIC PROTEASE IN GUARD CELL 2 [Brachypodium distachyon]KQJ85282.1 hypothetical protein BRADI_5g26130v3 [Brachypodium distachyon]|eukprot:XP_003580821.1 protein ASPARTIC PROTEASE IN GUARD CELL 2 [Brachypodium distachyon]
MDIAVTSSTLLLFLLAFVSTSGASPPSSPSLRFQYINPRNFTAAAAPSVPSSTTRRPSLQLLHRDTVSGTKHPSRRHAVLALASRDTARVAYLQRRLSPSPSPSSTSSVESGGTIVSHGSGEYLVRVGIGSPPLEQHLVADTGSDVIWVQCSPCSDCYAQGDPLFDPANSASFSPVPCNSGVCRAAARYSSSSCGGGGGECEYKVSYGDKSYTNGVLALETLTLDGGTEVQGVAMGCGHENRGLFAEAAGLLGLGWGPMSLVGQLGGAAGGAFSYCLAGYYSGEGSGSGSLVLGREDAAPTGAVWVPLVRNPDAPSFYYVGVNGLGVAGERLQLQDGLFDLGDDGGGGVVMDTGTAVTRLPAEAYAALRGAFAGAFEEGAPRAPGVSLFDTCYDLSGYASVRVPTVALYFGGGGQGQEAASLTLPARNLLVPVDDGGTYCLAFAAVASGPSILGNIQQQGIEITVDSASGYVGFGPATC